MLIHFTSNTEFVLQKLIYMYLKKLDFRNVGILHLDNLCTANLWNYVSNISTWILNKLLYNM